jgi:hypothetical protein
MRRHTCWSENGSSVAPQRDVVAVDCCTDSHLDTIWGKPVYARLTEPFGVERYSGGHPEIGLSITDHSGRTSQT